jgi:hypothetical protein
MSHGRSGVAQLGREAEARACLSPEEWSRALEACGAARQELKAQGKYRCWLMSDETNPCEMGGTVLRIAGQQTGKGILFAGRVGAVPGGREETRKANRKREGKS